MISIPINEEALKQSRERIKELGNSGPSVQEIMQQDLQKAQHDAYKQQQDLAAKQQNERMKLGAKMDEAAMKNEIALQQSREANALDFQKHKLTTEMQARQPQYTAGGPTAQQAVNNQYASNQVPRHLGSIG